VGIRQPPKLTEILVSLPNRCGGILITPQKVGNVSSRLDMLLLTRAIGKLMALPSNDINNTNNPNAGGNPSFSNANVSKPT
jgi:hypothetical protein